MIDVDPDMIYSAVAGLYRAAYEPASWDDALRAICAAFSGSKICVTRAAKSVTPGENIAPDADPRFVALYSERFAVNELMLGALPMPVGRCYRDFEVLDRDARRRSTFFNEWLAPQDMYGGLTCKLQADDNSFWFVDVQRGRNQDAFTRGDFDLFRRLAPHFRQAIEMGSELRGAREQALMLEQMPVAAILADAHMQVVLHNAAAAAILDNTASPLRLARGRLVATDAQAASRLQDLVGRIAAPPDPALPGLGGELYLAAADDADMLGLSLSVRPLPATADMATRGRAAIFITPVTLSLPANAESNLRGLFALTPKEAAIAAALAAGQPLKTVAARQNITLSTARFYLHRIFQKTNTRQQSHLVSLLKSLQPRPD